MRIIGDVHGKMDRYKKVIAKCDESVQLGDMNFTYEALNDVSLDHRFIKGNHDGYNITDPHELGDYGVHRFMDMFYVRGALSIDRMYRMPGVDWFEEEQITMRAMIEAIEKYTKLKPSVMLSHDCPQSVCEQLFGYTDKPLTRQGLQVMFENHQPDLWIFGHHHHSKNEVINGTNFICLKELEWMDLK